VALIKLRRRDEVRPGRPPDDSGEEQLGFPASVIPSIAQFLGPFWDTTASSGLSSASRDFVQEAAILLRLRLDWSGDQRRAAMSLWTATYKDPQRLVALVDFALRNILVGYSPKDAGVAAGELDRHLRDAGSPWQVRSVEGFVAYFLERRVDAGTTAALAAATSVLDDDGAHLVRAWERAYGRDPDPGGAYAEAVKAVEAAARTVVTPDDPTATLEKIIDELRRDSTKWSCVFTEPTKEGQSPDEVVIAMLDLLMRNRSDQQPPTVVITQERAESTVHLALTLVQLFRCGAISRR